MDLPEKSQTEKVRDEVFDLHGTLDRQRLDQDHRLSRTLGIAFSNLSVSGLAPSDSSMPTLGSALNPFNLVKNIQSARHPNIRSLLTGFEGVARPGEMLLVIGRPGSGCSTFLKTLSNHREDFRAVDGDLHYDSLTHAEVEKDFRGDVNYCPEEDVHFPTLNVEQTISFAASCRTPQNRLGLSREEFIAHTTNIVESSLGLTHARKTHVGNAAIRGVSGGEKKRVSIAEALASRCLIGAWDSPTRGLDSSTALDFIRSLRKATRTFKLTTSVVLYQVGEPIFELFDKVCVIYEGRMAYYGRADEARQYFIDMGYEPANRQTTADYLVAVTDPNARIAREGALNLPRTADEFARYFLESPSGQRNRVELEEYKRENVGNASKREEFIRSAGAERAGSNSGPYLLSILQQVRIVMRRRISILRGDMLGPVLECVASAVQALIIGSVFFKTPDSTASFFSRGGVIFFAVLVSGINALSEIPSLYSQRDIVHRQGKGALYHPFVEALGYTLVDIPIAFANTLVYSGVVYFMAGLQRSASQFFIFFLFLFALSITMKGFFRSIAALFAAEAMAQTVAGVSVMAILIYTGYTIPKPSMIGALRWITYINPVKYGFEAVLANEFRTIHAKCANIVPQGPGYENITLANQVCTTVGSLPGHPSVDGERFVNLAFGFYSSHIWMNLGIVAAFLVFFVSTYLLLTEFGTSFERQDGSVPLFKRGSTRVVSQRSGDDEESGKAPRVYEVLENATASDAKPFPTSSVFSWHHVNYTVPISGEDDRTLLNDISGYVVPGKLTALMGESGAGKTTLLNVLAGRTDVGVVTGDRLVNGQRLPSDFEAQTGYCQQMDTHVPLATVRESLLFSAKLRQPLSVSLEEKEAYVEKCLEMCGLFEYADAAVGSLSIENRKRTTIAVELAAKPKLLLFVDEPTTGLDSQSAWAIISCLRTLADNGQAILCTIHLPSAELFQVFDRILLLKKGGKTVYFGDLGDKATKLINYFESNGARQCRQAENPAEYMLDVIGAGATAVSERDWSEIWKSAPESEAVSRELVVILSQGDNAPPVEASFRSEFATPWWFQLKELFKRDLDAHWRDATYLIAKLTLNAVGGLFVGFTFFKAQDTLQGIQNKLFAIFLVAMFSVPLAEQLQVPFLNMRSIYEIRERPTRMYSWSALIASQFLSEIPWNILGASILFCCWYWTVGFAMDRAGYTYLMLSVATPIFYTTFAQACAAMAPTADVAGAIFGFFFLLVLIFNGVLQPYARLGWWKWMYHASPFTYLIEGLLGQTLGRRQVTCSPIELVEIVPPAGQTCGQYMAGYISFAGGYLENPAASSSCKFCSVHTTDTVLEGAYNIFYKNHWRDFGIVLAFSALNLLLVFLFTYLFRIRQVSLLSSLKPKKTSK